MICSHCKQAKVIGCHDPCIANLPGVKYACCGHGEGPGYISFDNGLSIYFTIDYIVDWSTYVDDGVKRPNDGRPIKNAKHLIFKKEKNETR